MIEISRKKRSFSPRTGSIAFSVNLLTCMISPFAIADMTGEDVERDEVDQRDLWRTDKVSNRLLLIQWWMNCEKRIESLSSLRYSLLSWGLRGALFTHMPSDQVWIPNLQIGSIAAGKFWLVQLINFFAFSLESNLGVFKKADEIFCSDSRVELLSYTCSISISYRGVVALGIFSTHVFERNADLGMIMNIMKHFSRTMKCVAQSSLRDIFLNIILYFYIIN